MAQPKPIQKLMQSEMSRREFLGFVGGAILAVIGVTGLLRGLNSLAVSHVSPDTGSSAYGGGAVSRPARKL